MLLHSLANLGRSTRSPANRHHLRKTDLISIHESDSLQTDEQVFHDSHHTVLAAMGTNAQEEDVTVDMKPRYDEKPPVAHNEKETLELSATDNENDTPDFVTDDKQPLDANEAEKQTPSDSSNDENVIFWDGDDDPSNPYNWPSWLKVCNCVLVSSLTFLTPLGSCKPRLHSRLWALKLIHTSYVRSRRPRADARVRQQLFHAWLLRCVNLCTRLRCRAHDLRPHV